MALGGNHITSDIAHGLRLDTEQAERVKLKHGHASAAEVPAEEFFNVRPFGEGEAYDVSRLDLTEIINARAEEIFSMVLQEIKRSGYDGLLPAGMVLTGGTSQLSGIRTVANDVMGLPVRIAGPRNLLGMTDQLYSPAYSTSVGLLNWAMLMNEIALRPRRRSLFSGFANWERIKDILRRLLP